MSTHGWAGSPEVAGRGRPREHDDRTRGVLLGAAELLAQEHGAAAVSVRTVAQAAGTSTRAVYSVFGSKAGLLDALAERFFELLTDAFDAVPSTGDPISDVVTASVEGFRRTALDHPALYAIVFLQAVPDLRRGPRYQESAAAAFGRLVALLDRVRAAGALGPHSPEEGARAVHALTEGLATVELRDGLAPAPEALWRGSLIALLRGLNVSMQRA